MPAYGKDGLHNLNNSAKKEVWKVCKSDGTALMSCDTEAQAQQHKQSLSQKMNLELSVVKGELSCI